MLRVAPPDALAARPSGRGYGVRPVGQAFPRGLQGRRGAFVQRDPCQVCAGVLTPPG
jgi:hypothetical protein